MVYNNGLNLDSDLRFQQEQNHEFGNGGPSISQETASLLRFRVNGLKKFSEKLASDFDTLTLQQFAFQMGKFYSRLCEIENIIVSESEVDG